MPRKSQEMLQWSLKLFDQGDLDTKPVDELLKLGDLHASFGAVYAEQLDRARSFESYTRAIACYEAAFRKGGVGVLQLGKAADIYWQAC